MAEKTILKFRNKFFLILSGAFTLLIATSLIVLYMFISSNLYHVQQSWLSSYDFIAQFNVNPNFYNDEHSFTILFDENRQIQQIFANFQLTADEKKQLDSILSGPSLSAGQYFGNGWRSLLNQLMYTHTLPQVHIDERDWMYTFIETFGENNEITNRYMILIDVSFVQKELRTLKMILLTIGIILSTIFIAFSFFIAKQFTQPIFKTFERQKQFIADASHELKTPLTIIKSNYAVLLTKKNETIHSQLKWFKRMEFGVERMTNLTHDLLVLAQVDSSDFSLKKSEFKLNEVTQNVLNSIEIRARDKSLDLDLQYDEDFIVKQDLEKITQVISILLDNAVKYTNEGGWISVEIKRDRGDIQFIVKNSGPGIEAEKLPNIFERFYRADESRNSKSSSFGLGLAIAKSIIEASGGKLEVSSICNEVTTFNFKIPSNSN